MHNPKLLFAILAVFLLTPFHSAKAAEIRAFHNINQLAFKQIFGLPSLDNSPLTEAGKWRLNLIANLSNTYNVKSEFDEELENDVETFRGSLLLSYGLLKNLQVGVEVPYISHNGGFLDDFIYDWHDFFNQPQNDRTKEESDLVRISYYGSSGSEFEMYGSEKGLGDIRINGAYTLPWNDRAFILSTELKFPTGDSDKLTGSGGYDFSIGLMLNDPQSMKKYEVTLFGGLAGVFLGDSDCELSENQNSFVLAGRAGIGWQATELIQLKVQLDGQTALYDSDLKEMGDPAFQVVMGGSFIFTDNAYLDVSVAEDLNTETAADVAFQLALVLTF